MLFVVIDEKILLNKSLAKPMAFKQKKKKKKIFILKIYLIGTI
jgi:hypothetical protein